MNKPQAIIVDVDGTLALMGDRSPYDWSRVGEDKPNEVIVELVIQLSKRYKIIIVSGRDGSCFAATLGWLRTYCVPYEKFLIRTVGNNEKDSIVKERIYRKEIEPFYDVQFVLDDRDQVVKMWRSLGLTCFQVADGNF